MGLMQLMPATWNEYRQRLRLRSDPYQPRANILAGAAYLHDLYERYGKDGFLAAYQAGPERYEEFMRDGRPPPRATLQYVARVQRAIGRIDAHSSLVPSPSAPAASALFVVLTARPSNTGPSPDRQLDPSLFVQLSGDPRSTLGLRK